MDVIVTNVRGSVAVATGAARHLLWYVRYQTGGRGTR
jgi:hypothetical protein